MLTKIRLKYLIKGAGLSFLDSICLCLYALFHIWGFYLLFRTVMYETDVLRLYPRGTYASFVEVGKSIPLAYLMGCCMWGLLIIGKLLRAPQGIQGCTLKEFLRSCLLWGSWNSMQFLERTARRIELETRLRQDNLFAELSTQQKRELAEASRSRAAAQAYRRLLAENQQKRPQHCYLAALAVVLATTLLSGFCPHEQSSHSETHAKQGSLTASMATRTTCHPPPSLGAWNLNLEKPDHHFDLCHPPAPPELERNSTEVGQAQRYWQYLRSLPEPPVFSIEHIPIASAQLSRFVVV